MTPEAGSSDKDDSIAEAAEASAARLVELGRVQAKLIRANAKAVAEVRHAEELARTKKFADAVRAATAEAHEATAPRMAAAQAHSDRLGELSERLGRRLENLAPDAEPADEPSRPARRLSATELRDGAGPSRATIASLAGAAVLVLMALLFVLSGGELVSTFD